MQCNSFIILTEKKNRIKLLKKEIFKPLFNANILVQLIFCYYYH